MSIESGKNFRAYRSGGIPSNEELVLAGGLRELVGEDRMVQIADELLGSGLGKEGSLKSNQAPFFAEMFQRILDKLR